MKQNIFSYIRHISARNLVFPIVIIIIMAILLIFLPVRSILFPPEARSADEIIELSDSGNNYIKIEINDLIYTGFDCYADNKPVASYYYIMTDDSANVCLFFLIPYDLTENGSLTLETFQAKAHIISSNPQFTLFLDEYADEIGWPVELLMKACGNYLINSYNYNSALAIIIFIIILLIIVCCFMVIMFNIITMINPSLHEACKRLINFGLDKDDFAEIDNELAHDCIVNAGNLFATTHYLIAFTKRNIFIIPLFNIIWAYKYSSWNKFNSGSRLKYTLVITTSPKDTVHISGNSKKNVDKILRFLGEDFTHIKIGYSDETKNEIDILLKQQ